MKKIDPERYKLEVKEFFEIVSDSNKLQKSLF